MSAIHNSAATAHPTMTAVSIRLSRASATMRVRPSVAAAAAAPPSASVNMVRINVPLRRRRRSRCPVPGNTVDAAAARSACARLGEVLGVRCPALIVLGTGLVKGNAADTSSWMPALRNHQTCFGKAPEMATGDRGFFSAANERDAQQLGVKKVALPARGHLSAKRTQQQKQRWFRRALRWRAGIEATLSTLKHPFSMLRATYKAETGFQRHVGWSVITKNLVCIARWQERRTKKRRSSDGQAQGIIRPAAQATE